MSKDPTEIKYFILIGVIISIVLVGSLISFVVFYMSRRRIDIEKTKAGLLRAQIEIQEQTSEHISREIHDDVGQVLSVARIYLQSVEQNEKIIKTNEMISRAITSLRNISHSLNATQILHTGIVNALETELIQIEESGKLKTLFNNNVERFEIKPDKELILFRTCQEALNNSIKHSDATNISIVLNEDKEQYLIAISDDGKGFDQEKERDNNSKNGLRNMQKRMELIGARMEIESNKGTTIRIIIIKDYV